jgi:glyoxylase-like metal-dependent hydrolase (beta-lactamase superfamily II)
VNFELIQVEVGNLANFNELIFDPRDPSGACVVVDPAYEVERLLALARDQGLSIEKILLTHTHQDHVDGAEAMARATSARIYVGAGELEAARRAAPSAVIEPVGDGTRIPLGGGELVALATPGHTAAGTSYLCGDAVVTGDTLFIGGCGRTDGPGGDPRTLWRSLNRLAALPDETRVYPGHDYGATPTSTIGRERDTNPYLRCRSEAEFVALRTGPNPPRPTRGPR